MPDSKPLDDFVSSIPAVPELRERLSSNLRERELIRKLLKLAEQRDRIRSVGSQHNA